MTDSPQPVTAPPPCMGGCEPRFADLTAAVTGVRVAIDDLETVSARVQHDIRGIATALDDQENAMAQIQHDIRAIATAVNSVGALTESHQTSLMEIVEAVRGFASSMNGMSPTSLIKGLLGGSRA